MAFKERKQKKNYLKINNDKQVHTYIHTYTRRERHLLRWTTNLSHNNLYEIQQSLIYRPLIDIESIKCLFVKV